MIDAIVHIKDLSAFRVEANLLAESTDKRVKKLESGAIHFVPGKINVKYLGNESVCLVKFPELNYIDDIEPMCILGVCINKQYIFNNDDDKLTYERVRGPLTATHTEEDGTITEYEKPYMIGVFA